MAARFHRLRLVIPAAVLLHSAFHRIVQHPCLVSQGKVQLARVGGWLLKQGQFLHQNRQLLMLTPPAIADELSLAVAELLKEYKTVAEPDPIDPTLLREGLPIIVESIDLDDCE